MKRARRMKRVRRMQRLKMILGALATVAMTVMAGQNMARAGEIDLLVDKLVEKDVLTRYEGQLVRDETRAEISRQNALGKNESLPKWIQTMQFKGDLRLRYQQEETDTTTPAGVTTTAKRERVRMRLRVGAQASVNNDWDVVFRLMSGSSDPRSGNQTMENNFSSKTIQIDQMYAKFRAADNVDIYGGKMDNTLWRVSDLLWSGDVSPEGFSAVAKLPDAISGVDLFLNTGWFLVDEISAGADPSLVYIQPGLETALTGELKLKAAANVYFFNALQGMLTTNLDNTGSTVTNTVAGNRFTYDYDSYGASLQLAYTPKSKVPFSYLALLADVITNPDPDDQNTGYLVGVRFGDSRVRDPGSWQATVRYRELEKDSWVYFLPGTDILNGQTDVKGFDLGLAYGLARNVTLNVVYAMSETLMATTKKEQTLLKVDLSTRF